MTGRGELGLWSGVGLVAAAMIGAGVFVSAGYMAQQMTAGWIMLGWLVGAALSLAGAYAYGEVARRVPRSGGEYVFLRELAHPALGYLAGWASLVVGFAAPAAINAASGAAFLGRIVPLADTRWVAIAIVVGTTAIHAFDLGVSKLGQNALIAVKVLLLGGFVALGVWAGQLGWPSWQPPGWTGSVRAGDFAGSLFFVAFAFSGWNAAVYASELFRDPARDVPRAMVIGCALVAVFYLIVNWVFVANLTPARAAVVTSQEADQITLAHVLAQDLVGSGGARFVSALAVVSFVSAVSAILMVGPRVGAAMARDRLLPRWFGSRDGRPPTGSVVVMGGLSLLLMVSHSVRQALSNVAAILVLFSALTVACLFWVKPRARAGHQLAAAIYVVGSAWMLYYGFRDNPSLIAWTAVVAAVALVSYWLTVRRG